MIIEKPVRKIKAVKGLPRDEILRQRAVIRSRNTMTKHQLEDELHRFERIRLRANYD